MTSDRPARTAARGPGDAADWQGDVHLGVRAWAGETPSAPPPEDPVAQGPDADPESVARTILLQQLTGRARSRHELRAKLASKDVPEEIAERLLDRFEEVGLVDDEAFARSWVQGRQAAKGLSGRALGLELRRKGVDDETARAVLDEIDPEDETELARALVRKKLRSVARLDRVTATRRLVGMLGRKGYGPGVAFAVVREELGEIETPDAD